MEAGGGRTAGFMACTADLHCPHTELGGGASFTLCRSPGFGSLHGIVISAYLARFNQDP